MKVVSLYNGTTVGYIQRSSTKRLPFAAVTTKRGCTVGLGWAVYNYIPTKMYIVATTLVVD